MIDDVWFYAHKLAAARRAHEIMQRDFVVIDSETTGLNQRDGFVELAVIGKNGDVLLNQRINPRATISHKAQEIHGISQWMVATEPAFHEIYSQFCQAAGGKTWVIYNAQFDAPILYDHICIIRGGDSSRFTGAGIRRALPMECRPTRIHCAMLLYAQFYGDYSDYHRSFTWQKLIRAAEHFNLAVEASAHSALGDCLRTLGVIRNMSDWYLQQEYAHHV